MQTSTDQEWECHKRVANSDTRRAVKVGYQESKLSPKIWPTHSSDWSSMTISRKEDDKHRAAERWVSMFLQRLLQEGKWTFHYASCFIFSHSNYSTNTMPSSHIIKHMHLATCPEYAPNKQLQLKHTTAALQLQLHKQSVILRDFVNLLQIFIPWYHLQLWKPRYTLYTNFTEQSTS